MASTYTRSQLDNYFKYIDLPLEYQLSASPTLNLEFLTALHIHQISAAPYENLILHYAASHTVSLDPQDLYQKIVINARGRGGYCMELASFFNHILCSLGFNAITAGVKTRPRYGGVPKGDYMGWSACVPSPISAQLSMLNALGSTLSTSSRSPMDRNTCPTLALAVTAPSRPCL